MALCQAELNQNDEALKNLNDSLKLKNDFPEALDAKGCILFTNKNYDEALNVHNDLVKKDNLNPEYHFKKESAERELKNYEDAIKSFDESIKIDPNNSKAMLLRGSCYDFYE